ncbi:PEPxxWA-CTERM sorting domain-containing protein [Sphingomonas abaci]|uniref:Ice-binding protein C-terminal domain-containing protein n=1 Tax=Sphingomonas abaci TaxID=237611 RepID=A0A7W7AJR3_9SPHN|nr:PEPxxWA-CTERM sorting domain-containing protein [Sphingomonas abaci]MBB4618343.1 hypothetical protein [Sphingomonas abaci]
MQLIKAAFAASALFLAPAAANATVVGSLGGGTGTFATLSSAGLDGGTVATLSGGTVYTSDRPFADMPAGTIFGNTFLAAGPLAGQPATLNFGSALSYLSFLWGSPDTWNRLTVNTNLGSYDFTVNSLNFAVRDGNQAFSQYVQFAASAGESITGVTFTNDPARDAFEVANFNYTLAAAAVPEPATWAMMLLGFGMIGAAARYRRRGVAVTYA